MLAVALSVAAATAAAAAPPRWVAPPSSQCEFAVLPVPTSWEAATRQCASARPGARLALVQTATEAAFVAKRVLPGAAAPAWVFGFHEDGAWNVDFSAAGMWADGFPLAVAPGSPVQCAFADSRGEIGNTLCSNKMAAVCKWCPTLIHHHETVEDEIEDLLDLAHGEGNDSAKAGGRGAESGERDKSARRRRQAITTTTTTPAATTTTTTTTPEPVTITTSTAVLVATTDNLAGGVASGGTTAAAGTTTTLLLGLVLGVVALGVLVVAGFAIVRKLNEEAQQSALSVEHIHCNGVELEQDAFDADWDDSDLK